MKFKIGRYAGIDVFLHWTFILLPIYFLYDWKVKQGLTWPVVAFLMTMVFAVFVCVLLHEYGHALAARWFGVATQDIILTPIGGLARLEGMPKRALEEFVITIAGPAVNLVLAVLFALSIYIMHGSLEIQEVNMNWEGTPMILLWVNLTLFLFNLIPAFPMDGGRILRSSLSFFIDRRKATTIASWIGQTCAVAFFIYGINSDNYALSAIGVFVFFAARMESGGTRRGKKRAFEF